MDGTQFRSRLNAVLPQRTTRDLVTPIFRHKALVVFVFTAVFALSAYFEVAVAGKYYVASMQIVVRQHRTDPTITAGQTGAIMNTSRGSSPDQISSESALLRRRDVLRSLHNTCGWAHPRVQRLISLR